MVKFLFLIISIFLILVIFIRVPQENIGLAEPSSLSQKGLNILTAIAILIYFGIAIKLNFNNL